MDARPPARQVLARERTGARVALGCLLLLGLCLSVPPVHVAALQQGDEIRENALRVFLDCDTFRCDSDYFRTEIGFVNWVRDRTLSDVHLIITANETGGGGDIFTLDFIGLEELTGDDDQLYLTTLSTDTEDEILTGLTAVIAAGLARYSAAIGQPGAFLITPAGDAAPDTDELVTGDQVQDPWNFWVFEIGSNFELQGEDTEKQRRLRGSFDARRTTQTWKFEFEADGDFRRDERDLEDGDVVIDDRTNWSADALLVRALADRWSVGILAGAGASTRRNQNFGANFATALEFSFFPYVDAPRQSLTARYDLGIQHFDWEEETIFFETAETRPRQRLRLELFQRQPWGESRVSIGASQFLHDSSKWALSMSGDLEFRIVRGLNLEIGGDLELIEDQLFISREGLTDEEILLGRFQRPTDSAYEIQLGLSFEFGSIFNNVVNNRFD